MFFQYNLTKLVIILNWLLALFPISFILGNLFINLHLLIFITLGCIYLNKKKIKSKQTTTTGIEKMLNMIFKLKIFSLKSKILI